MSLHGPHSHIPPQAIGLLDRIARKDRAADALDPELLSRLETRSLIVVYKDPPRPGRFAGLSEEGWRRLRAEKPAPHAPGWELDLQVAETVFDSTRRVEARAKGFAVRVDHDPGLAGRLGIAQSATVKTAPGVGSPPLFQPSTNGGLALALLDAAGDRLGVMGIDLRVRPHHSVLLRYAAPGDNDPHYISADGETAAHAICRALLKAARRIRRERGA